MSHELAILEKLKSEYTQNNIEQVNHNVLSTNFSIISIIVRKKCNKIINILYISELFPGSFSPGIYITANRTSSFTVLAKKMRKLKEKNYEEKNLRWVIM